MVRSRDNRVLLGVAGGLGERLGVDPVLIRVAFAVLAIAGGSGVV
ncbi:MAG TPA: PspC domain-containing protein, partial [Actinomycetota bacterium]|nr:PspC domain-containing protein [Actinomycetota bacterium]